MSAAPAVPCSPPQPVRWPADGLVGPDWCRSLADALCEASQAEAKRLPRWLPSTVLHSLAQAASAILATEDTLVELQPPAGASVVVVGDTHGQLHDVLRLLELRGPPSQSTWYVFNGDFVDRGAWGVEVLTLVLAWKVALPACVTVLRGNHESRFCTRCYGFAAELAAKFTGSAAKALDARLLRLFSLLPLGCRVGRTFICHGGLFRKPTGAKTKRARAEPLALSVAALPLSSLGGLEDLRHAHRGGPDPDGEGVRALASDVLWSDPAQAPGLFENSARGIGLVFGPDATASFLAANGLRLVIRSHEGPDARLKRPWMPSVDSGYCEDHVLTEGKLVTLFSAPDYPQFSAPGEARAGNTAAVAVLTAPDWCEPAVLRFEAAPRPRAAPFYELDTPGSDDEGPEGGGESKDGYGSASEGMQPSTQ